MSGEEGIGAWGSADPDDLAAYTCAAVRAAGLEPRVVFRWDKRTMRVTSIDVYVGDRPVAAFPCHPMVLPNANGVLLAAAIETVGRLLEPPRDARRA